MNIAYYIFMVAAIISAIYILITNGIRVYRLFRPEYDEYVCKLGVVIYYNKDEQNVTADFSHYEEDQKVIVRIYSVKTYEDISPEEKELEGQEIYNERAVLRCAKGTHDPVAWWYLDERN